MALISCIGPLVFGLIFINTQYFGFKADDLGLAVICEIYAFAFIVAVACEIYRIAKQLLDEGNTNSMYTVCFSNCQNPSFFTGNLVVVACVFCFYGAYVGNKFVLATYYFPTEIAAKHIAESASVMVMFELFCALALGTIARYLAQMCKLMCTKSKEYDQHATLEQIKHVV